jgi:uncharacterized surface protein with fasciclin (FAS1) repeats
MKKNMKTTTRKFYILILALCQFVWIGCIDDSIVESYYTFTGDTVGSFLKNPNKNPNREKRDFSKFIRILERANMLDQLSTYGEYTCFAPINSAIDTLLLQKNLTSVEDLSDAECDTIARTHLIEGLFFTTDLEVGAIANTNFLDRYLMYSTASDSSTGKLTVAYYINKTAEMLVRDDSVSNGVVHTLNRVVTPSNRFLPQLIQTDTTISIFSDLLFLTGLDQKMLLFQDEKYSIGADSTILGNASVMWPDGGRQGSYPEKRKFAYTAFIEPNSVYRNYGANSAQDVIRKLTKKDDVHFLMNDPNSKLTYDNNFTDSNNVVNRFVAYHLQNRLGNYNQWNVSATMRDNCVLFNYLDAEDFYETMCWGTMIKIQTTREGQVYINRRRINEGAGAIKDAADPFQVAVRGVRIKSPTEVSISQDALNGVYHYIDALLIYGNDALDALNTRMRIDATTLSPDFLNNVGRNRQRADGSRGLVTRYKKGFVTNFNFSAQTLIGVRNDPDWSPSFGRDGLDFLGQYDFTVKIPPVPEGQYEVRLGINASNDRGIVQVYIDDEPCGIPIDMRIYKSDPKIGSVDDGTDLEQNKRNDKDLKNRGYMKGPDSWNIGTLNSPPQTNLRMYFNSMRIILSTKKFVEGEAHYLRFKSVIDNPSGIFPFDYLELCPKSVYGAVDGEDTH